MRAPPVPCHLLFYRRVHNNFQSAGEEVKVHGSTQDGKLAPTGVIQIHGVLPVEYSSPIKRPQGGSAALLGNSPW
jgi:hypothetical protein